IVGYHKLDGWPLVATTGVARTEALQQFRSSLRAGMIVGLPTVAIMALGTLWIASLLGRGATGAGARAQCIPAPRDPSPGEEQSPVRGLTGPPAAAPARKQGRHVEAHSGHGRGA